MNLNRFDEMVLSSSINVPRGLLPTSGPVDLGSNPFVLLKKHISKHGLLTPIYATSGLMLIEGLYRFLACVELKHKEVPVRYVNSMKEAKKAWSSGVQEE